MTEACAYLLALALFSFVVIGSAKMRDDMLVLACFPPVFVAMIMGFIMAIYAGASFGAVPTGLAFVVGAPPAWWLANRMRSRDLLLAIYLAWAAALLLSLVAFGFPDRA